MFAGIISGVLFKIVEWVLSLGYTAIAKLVEGWMESKRQDEIDKRVKDEIKNPDRRRAAGDLDRSFDE